MKDPTTDKKWADYLSDVLRRLDALATLKRNDAPVLRNNVYEVTEPLAHLIGYLIG